MPLVGLALIVMLSAAACRGGGSGTAPAMALPTTISPAATNEPTATVEPTATAAPEPTAETPADPLAGLIFRNQEGLWLISRSGEPILLTDQTLGRVSPDGSQVAYWHYGEEDGPYDIWLLDLESGEEQNLTQSPERYDGNPMWWPARPGVLLFGSDLEQGPGYGYPSTVNLDGSAYRFLDATFGGMMAPSPDGRTIAYGSFGESGRFYDWQTGSITSFNPADVGGESIEKLYGPAWSPDGRTLAWEVGGSNLNGSESWSKGVALFDVAAGSTRFAHVHAINGGGSFPTLLAWSPDGEWLAFVTFGEDGGRTPNLWVINTAEDVEIFVGQGVDPVWSPNGRWLAYTGVEQSEALLADTETWHSRRLDIDSLALLDWILPAR